MQANQVACLIVGHSPGSMGAVNKNRTFFDGVREVNLNEFVFNNKLVDDIIGINKNRLIKVLRTNYAYLPYQINSINPSFSISLHCNAFNTKVSGTEVLYYHLSDISSLIANILIKHLIKHLELPDRGIKPVTVEDRGGYLLKYTKSPCVISEPFFIDNDSDYDNMIDKGGINKLTEVYSEAIDEIFEMFKK